VHKIRTFILATKVEPTALSLALYEYCRMLTAPMLARLYADMTQ
jgi:hypothetical protein